MQGIILHDKGVMKNKENAAAQDQAYSVEMSNVHADSNLDMLPVS